MPTRTQASVFTELEEASALYRYSLTKHMMFTWHRFDLRHRFHLNSDRSRLQYIVWYLIDHLANKDIAIDLVPPALLAELNRPAMAWGPLSTFMFELWRERFASDPSRNIQTEEGYVNFVVDYVVEFAPRYPALRALVPTGAVAEIQKPHFYDGVHHLSRGAASIWRRSSLYREKYHDISDPFQVDAFNFDLIIQYVARHGCTEIVAPEASRYWAAPVMKSEPRLSRFAFALAAVSPRFNNAGDGLDVLNHVNSICDWFAGTVVSRFPLLGRFDAGTIIQKESVFEKQSAAARAKAGIPTPGSAPGQIDILIIGPFSAASGLGTGTRRSLEALQAIGANFRAADLLFDNPSVSLEAIPEKLRYAGETAKVTLWHFNAEYLPDALIAYPHLINPNRNIGYFFWETEALPRAHQLACDLVDEIWAPSEFVRNCYVQYAKVDVVNVSTAVNIPKVDLSIPRSYFGLSDAFTFMFSFDAHSVIHRKNPAAVARAFRLAFPNNEPVALVIKTQNLSDAHWGGLFGRNEELFELCDADSRIQFMNRTLSLRELYSLKSRIDCYVSLHRSEGFGYGPAEAMALGKPVIMTDYSANTEFGNADNCLLVKNKLIPVLDTEYLYWTPDMVWADIDVEDAARCMRLVYNDRDLGARLGKKARETIERDFGIPAMATKYRTRLEQLGFV